MFDVLKPDLVIVFDSHWFTTVEFVITVADRRLGFYTSDELPRGMSSVPYDVQGDPAFAKLVGEIADGDTRVLDHADRQRAPARSSTPRRTSSVPAG